MVGLRYDHPNAVVRREKILGLTTVGTASVTTYRLGHHKKRLKAVHFNPTILGTSDTWTQTIRTITGVTTASVGIDTMGTVAVNLVASARRVLLGVGNSPPGVEVDADALLTITNAVDGTGQTEVTIEYEVLPDAVLA